MILLRSITRSKGLTLSPLACSQVRTYTSVQTVPLAFDLHQPPLAEDGDQKKSPIIFMHGLFGSKKNNRSMSKVLTRDLGRSVYAVDLRNHGDSPHNPHHDYFAMSDDIARFIDEHELQDSTLVGHSMGAKTAMAVALRYPQKVSNIISVDNAPVDAALLSNFGKYIQGMKKIDQSGVTSLTAADKILQEYEDNITVRQFLLGNLHRPKDEKTQKFKVPLQILGKSLDFLGDFPYKNPDDMRFGKPALFVRGTQSKYVPDEALPIIGQFFPLFKLVDIDAGHWVISEKPEEFRQAVVEFLSPKD